MKHILLFYVLAFCCTNTFHSNAQQNLWFLATGDSTQGYDVGKMIQSDPNGDIIACGSFYGNINLDINAAATGAMTSTGGDAFFAKYTTSGALLWKKQITGPAYESIYDMKVDNLGNIYLTGTFASTADFDPSISTAFLTSYGNSSNIFLAKYDNNGNYKWAKSIGSNGNTDNGFSIAIDNNYNVIMGGHFTGSTYFDPTNNAGLKNSLGGMDAFIAKYDSAGNFSWVNTVASAPHWERCLKVEVDNNNNIYALGEFESVIDIDASANVMNITPIGGGDVFIIKYNAAGATQWGKSFGSNSLDLVPAFTIHNNSFYIAGGSSDTIDFDFSANTMTFPNPYYQRAFVAKYDLNSNLSWVKQFPDSAYSEIQQINVDNSHILLAGLFSTYSTPFDFDLGIGTKLLSANSIWGSAFMARYDTAMNYNNVFAIDATYLSQIYGFQTDNSDNIYITGYFRDTIDSDPTLSVSQHISNGNEDLFIGKYTFSNPSSIVSYNLLNEVKLYPNPATTELKLQYNSQHSSNLTIEISNTLGQTIWQQEYIGVKGQTTTMIPIGHLTDGLYLIKIKNGFNEVYTNKFIKQ